MKNQYNTAIVERQRILSECGCLIVSSFELEPLSDAVSRPHEMFSSVDFAQWFQKLPNEYIRRLRDNN